MPPTALKQEICTDRFTTNIKERGDIKIKDENHKIELFEYCLLRYKSFLDEISNLT